MDHFRAAASEHSDWSDNTSPSTSEDCGANSPKGKGRKFVLLPDWETPTKSELSKQQRKFAVTLTLQDNATETGIRELVITKFLTTKKADLRDTRFDFVTIDDNGGEYNCACSIKCNLKYQEDHPSAEWSSTNIRRAAKGNRNVYIRKTVDSTSADINYTPATNRLCIVEPKHRSEDSGVEVQVTQRFLELDITHQRHINQDLKNVEKQPSAEELLDPVVDPNQEAEDMEEMMEPVKGKVIDITPEKGDIAGGDNFVMTVKDCLPICGRNTNDGFFVRFGESGDENRVLQLSSSSVKGKVPRGSEVGFVLAHLFFGLEGNLQLVGVIPFEYTEEKKEKNENDPAYVEHLVEKQLVDEEKKQGWLMFMASKMDEGERKRKKATNDNEQCENDRTEALSLLRMMVETAAKINAMKFFTIIFSTPVARSVFKCFKDEQVRLEEVARENGNEELACFLEEKHKMYQPDESDSDDEVDWRALSKAAAEYRRQNAESIEAGVVADTASSESSQGYYGDPETSSSDIQSNVSEPEKTSNYNEEDEEIRFPIDQTVGPEPKQQEKEPESDDLIGEDNSVQSQTLKDSQIDLQKADKEEEVEQKEEAAVEEEEAKLDDLIGGHKNPLECDGLIVDLSEEIGTSWKKLGSKLGISINALDSIEDEKNKSEERAFDVLKTWSRKEGNLANMRKFSISLESIGRKDVAEKIPRHKNPLECDGLIIVLSEEIGTSWKKLGSKLGISHNVLDSIEDEKNKNEERAFEVLQTWSRKEGNLANMRKLSISLKSIGRKDVAEKIPPPGKQLSLPVSVEEEEYEQCDHPYSLARVREMLRQAGRITHPGGQLLHSRGLPYFLCTGGLKRGPYNEKRTLHLDIAGPDDTIKLLFLEMLKSDDEVELETTKEERIYMKLGKFNKELQRLSDILATKEVREDKLNFAVRLDTCKRLNSDLQKLYTCAKHLITETSQCDEALQKKVIDSVDGLRALHNVLTIVVEDLQSSTADVSEEEKEKWGKLVRYKRGLQTQATRMDIFLKPEPENRPRNVESTPEQGSKREELPQRSNTYPREQIVFQSFLKRLVNMVSKKDTSDSDQCSLTAFRDANSRCGNN